jgi:hypothetical protein
VSTAKEPIDLRASVQERLDQLTFMQPLRLNDVSQRACAALDEGTSSDFTQGVQLNETVAIFLDHWGMKPHQYSFAVFEKTGGSWQHVCSRIEQINEAVASAIHTLAERALRSGARA